MSGVARRITLAAVIAALATCAAPAPASAFSPANAICSLTGLISTLAGKACSVAAHPDRIIGAGKALLRGHLRGAIQTITSGGAAKAVAARVGLAAIVTAVSAGASFALRKTASFISSTTRPNLQSTWFSASYWRVAGVSALLTLPFLFAAAIQALLRSDLALLVRAAFGYLPLGLLAVGVAAPLTMLLLAASDELSAIVSSASGHAGATFLSSASVKLGAATLITGTPFLVFFVGLLTAAATLVLWVELLVRDAAVYVIVLLLPLFFAALVWPARRVWAIRAVELLVALILSKFAIVAVLGLGGAALEHSPVPGLAAFLSGVTLVLLASFSPWALLRLLPLHELASAAAGGLHAAPKLEVERGARRAGDAANQAGQGVADLQAHVRDWMRAGQGGGADAAAVDRDAEPGGDAAVSDREGSPGGEAAGLAPQGAPAGNAGGLDRDARPGTGAGVSRSGEALDELPAAGARAVAAGDEPPPLGPTEDRRGSIAAPFRTKESWPTLLLGSDVMTAKPSSESDPERRALDPAGDEDHDLRPPAQDPDDGRL